MTALFSRIIDSLQVHAIVTSLLLLDGPEATKRFALCIQALNDLVCKVKCFSITSVTLSCQRTHISIQYKTYILRLFICQDPVYQVEIQIK